MYKQAAKKETEKSVIENRAFYVNYGANYFIFNILQ